ncbi:MAG TPA: PAS domain-containing protein, partial [Candidatus Binataceae bacterium]|nr:PAS domain-containing protein [Candidatus Binataceae bacterium]
MSTALNRWRDIIDSLPDALVVLAPDYEPVAANPAAETMLGVSPVTKSLVSDLLRTNEWLSRMASVCFATGQGLGDAETELHVGPRSIAVRAEVAPIARGDGSVDQIIIFLHDLSHQKTAERASESGGLALRLSPAGLAHEVKNPLTGIKGAAELLAAMFPGDGRAQQYCT